MFALGCLVSLQAQTYTVSTLAGGPVRDGPAATAKFNIPGAVAVTADGTVYVADVGNNRIRKITSGGIVSTLAGSGAASFADGPGETAHFYNPYGVAVDGEGNVYVADTGNHRIRKITIEGVVSTLAGSGISGFANGTGTDAQFKSPRAVAVDATGNVYVADSQNHRIRKITSGGFVSTLAGSGTAGFLNGSATTAQFASPLGLDVDATGNVYVADTSNRRIRKVTSGGTVSTLAGTGAFGYVDGPGTTAQFSGPWGVAVDGAGNILVADTNSNHRIRKVIATTGVVSTVAGSGSGIFAEGTGTAASFYFPSDLGVDGAGNIYVADMDNHRIRIIADGGVVSTFAGSGLYSGFADGPVAEALFLNPYGLAVDGLGNAYVADTNNHRIRKITPEGVVSSLAGSGVAGFAEGSGAEAQFSSPREVAVDAAGNVYVSDTGNHRIRKITSGGLVSTLAGLGVADFANGSGLSARFSNPYGIRVDSAGNVYVADTSNNRVRKITAAGVVSTFAGSGTYGFADGSAAAAQFASPSGLALDGAGNVYVTEGGNRRVRKISPLGVVSTLAGSGLTGYVDGPGSSAQFNGLRGCAVDGAGNVYVADSSNRRIRKITSSGEVSTFAGSGLNGFGDGSAENAHFTFTLSGLAVDPAGRIYAADWDNHAIRVLIPPPSSPAFTGASLNPDLTLSSSYNASLAASGYPAPTFSVQSGSLPTGLTLDSATGAITGTPTTVGTFTGVFAATNSEGTATQPFTFTITPAPTAPTFTSSALSQGALLNNSFSHTLTASGNPAPTFSVQSGALPPGLSLASTGAVTGTPTTAGTFTGVFAATNSQGTATQSFTILVIAPQSAPSFTSTALNATIYTGNGYTSTLTASGNPAPTFSVQSGSLPSGLTLNSASGILSGTPNVSGTYTGVFAATNTQGTATQAFTFSITEPPPPPAPPSFGGGTFSASLTRNLAYSGSIYASGNPSPTYSITSGSLPPGISLSGGGALSGTPTTQGTYTGVFTATNSQGSANQSFSLVVGPEFSAPVFTSSAINSSHGVGSAYTGSLSASGNPSPTFAVTGGSLPPGLSLASNGALTGTFSSSGTYTGTFTATNSQGSTQQAFTFIIGVAPAITAHPVAPGHVLVGGSFTLSVGASGSGLSYLWFKDTSPIPGATGPSYTVNSAQTSDAGSYTAFVTNSFGNVTSEAATIIVYSAPSISTHPTSRSVAQGGSTTFSVVATGTAPLGYQWQRNNSDLPGQTSASLTLSDIQPGAAGDYRVVVTNPYGFATSNSATLSIDTPPVVTGQSPPQFTVPGGSTTLSVTASGTAPFSYAWYRGSVGDTSTPVGTNSASFTTPALSATTAYWVRVTNSVGSGNSSPFTVTVGAAPIITTGPQAPAGGALFGTSLELSVSATGDGTLNYQWYKGSDPVPGATSASLSLINLSEASAGTYFVSVSSVFGTASSASTTLVVNTPPAITAQPQSRTILLGAATSFSVTATGTAPLYYQWRKNDEDIPGATSATHEIAAATAADVGSYTVLVTNSYGFATSNPATLALNIPPAIGTQPVGGLRATGQTISFSVAATGTAPLSYQWYLGATGDTSTPVGTNSSAYTTPALSASSTYWVRVSNPYGHADSNGATVTVGDAPAIGTGPVSATVLAGQSVSFSVTATGEATLLYAWSRNHTPIPDATSATLALGAVTAAQAGDYRVTVSNPYGSVTSAAATLTVNVPPSISSHPQNVISEAGNSANFSVTAAGTGPLFYQWQHEGVDLPGRTTPALLLSSVGEADAGSYRCVVTSTYGTATSNPATLTVRVPVSITQHTASASLARGSTKTLTVLATGSAPLTYQWYRGNPGDTSLPVGTDSATYTTPALDTTSTYWVRVTNAFSSADGAAIVITVGQPPAILDPPTPVTVVTGANATFSVSAGGDGVLSYQWQRDGISIPVGSNASAATTTLLLTNASLGDAASYRVVVSSAFGSITSAAAALTVNSPPFFTAQPQNIAASVGNSRVLNVAVGGTDPIAFAWRQNGQLIPGISGPVLNLGALTLDQAGTYTVTATNAFGSATSDPANVSVTAPPSATALPVTGTYLSGQAATLALTATGSAPLSYQWYRGSVGDTSTPVGGNFATFNTGALSTTSTFWARVTNPHGSADVGPFLVIINPPTPVITSALSASVTAGQFFSYTIAATNQPSSFYATDLPDGLAINPATGLVSGIPTQPGLGSINLGASNASGTGTATLALTVNPAAPVLTSPASLQGRVGVALNYQITATHSPTSFGATSLPAGLTVNPSTGLVSGTPTTASTGSFGITATNPGGTGAASVDYTIGAAIDPPVITSAPNAAGRQASSFSFTLAASNSPTSFSATGLPAWLLLNAATGRLSGTPPEATTLTLEVSAANSGGSGPAQTLTLSFAARLDVPVITSLVAATGRQGQSFTYQITASNSPTAYSATGLPAGLTLDPATGLISGTPAVSGEFNATLLALNSAGAGPAQNLRLTLAAPLSLPVIGSAGYVAAQQGAFLQFDLTASNSPTSFTALDLPAGLALNPTTGRITGTPTVNGRFTARVGAVNADGAGPLLDLVFEIAAPPQAPVLSLPPTLDANIGKPFRYTLNVAPSASSFTAAPLPAGLALDPILGVIAGTPVREESVSVQVTATGSGGTSQPVTFLLRVLPAPETPSIGNDALARGRVGLPYGDTLFASNPPLLNFSATNLPPGLSLQAATGVLGGTPTVAGTYTATFRATNASGQGSARDLSITIDPPSAVPAITSATTLVSGQATTTTYQISATNQPTSYAATGLPEGLRLDPLTGLISGAPTRPGAYPITLSATNLIGSSRPLILNLTVTPAPSTPRITSPTTYYLTANTAFSIQLTATALPTQRPLPAGNSFQFSGYNRNYYYFWSSFYTTMPKGWSFNPATGLLSGNTGEDTVEYYYNGYRTDQYQAPFSLTFYAINTEGAGAPVSILIYINPPTSSSPVITGPTSLSAVQGTPKTFDVLVNRTVNYTSFRDSFGIGSYANSSINQTYTPLFPGSYTYTLTATIDYYSSGFSSGWRFAQGVRTGLPITVQPAPDAPTLTMPTVISARVGEALLVPIQTNGTNVHYRDANPAFPSGLYFSAGIEPDSLRLSGTPQKPGSYRFSAYASKDRDGTGNYIYSAPQEILVVVQPALGAPVVGSGGPGRRILGAYVGDPIPATQGQPFTFTLTAGAGIERWEVQDLPPGLSLNENTGEISGLPEDSGPYDITVTAFNGAGASAPVVLRILIAAPAGSPVVTSPATATAQVGQPFSYSIAATGTPESYTVEDLPETFSFDGLNGAITGTPTLPGQFTVQLRATNAAGLGLRQPLTVTVLAAAGTPVVTGPATTTYAAGQTIAEQITATLAPTHYGASALPPGLELNATTGALGGAPTLPGTYEVEFWAVNAIGEGDHLPVTLTVTSATGTPVITGPATVAAKAGLPFSVQLAATGSPSAFNAPLLPAWASFDPYTGTLTGTPSSIGSFPLAFSATNPAGTGAPFTLTIQVGAPSAYDTWTTTYYSGSDLLDPLKIAPDADPDGDGRKNLAEYALGSSPAAPDAGASAGQLIDTGSGWVFRFTRPAARDGVTYTVQTSPDLSTWTPRTHQVVATVAGIETVEAPVPTPVGRLFARLLIATPAAP